MCLKGADNAAIYVFSCAHFIFHQICAWRGASAAASHPRIYFCSLREYGNSLSWNSDHFNVTL